MDRLGQTPLSAALAGKCTEALSVLEANTLRWVARFDVRKYRELLGSRSGNEYSLKVSLCSLSVFFFLISSVG